MHRAITKLVGFNKRNHVPLCRIAAGISLGVATCG
jgi:hypothetical protein